MDTKKLFDCYKCKHRGTVPGSAHTRCTHPKASGDETDPMIEIMAIYASVERAAPIIGEGAAELGIKGNAQGISNGWFNWPFNFDPVWLDNCDGFEPKDSHE